MSADNIMPPLPLRTWRLSPAWDAPEEEAIYAYARAYAAAQCAPLVEALELIASPIRSDGTWNRDREACRQVAAKALAKP